MKQSKSWFEVSKEGLAEFQSRRGAEHLLFELWSNAADEPTSNIDIQIHPQPRGMALFTVEDDSPEGFRDLTDAFTLFTPTPKWKDPTKRGRFNFGEKLVLATCQNATIATTKGTVVFGNKGRRLSSSKRDKGSRFTGLLRVKKGDIERISDAVNQLIPPQGIVTKFNGLNLPPRTILATITAVLPTEIADAEGHLRPSDRKTTIEVYQPWPGESARVYEMGIPIAPTGDLWHYNVMQKVPLSSDRSVVRESYLKNVRVAVFNALYARVKELNVNDDWVSIAANSPSCCKEAFEHWKNLKFGEKAVAFDPNDLEANKRAVAEGYTVVSGRMMGSAAWDNARTFGSLPRAGKVTPSHKVWTGEDNPDAKPFEDWIPEEKWTKGMRRIAEYANMVAEETIGTSIGVKFCSSPHHLAAASYGYRELVFNKLRLGGQWFEQGIIVDVDALIIHELAHDKVSDHLSEEFYRELCRIGAELKKLALERPELFKEYR